MSIKYSTVGYLSNYCFQCCFLLRRNFEHSCDQVIFRMPFSKKKLIEQNLFSSKCRFLPLVQNENNNNEHGEYHGIFLLFRVQIYSKQGSHIPLLFLARTSTGNCNLTKFVGVQRLHENIK